MKENGTPFKSSTLIPTYSAAILVLPYYVLTLNFTLEFIIYKVATEEVIQT